jgi:hypothetical protein
MNRVTGGQMVETKRRYLAHDVGVRGRSRKEGRS